MKKTTLSLKKKLLLCICLLFVIAVFVFGVLPKIEFKLSFQYVCTIPQGENENLDPYDNVWAAINDEKNESWYKDFMPEKADYIMDYMEQNNLNSDTSKYTYIVVYQYDLDSLYFSFSRMTNAYTQFIGRAFLSNYEEGKTNIYRIRKMNLDSTYKGLFDDTFIYDEAQNDYICHRTYGSIKPVLPEF